MSPPFRVSHPAQALDAGMSTYPRSSAASGATESRKLQGGRCPLHPSQESSFLAANSSDHGEISSPATLPVIGSREGLPLGPALAHGQHAQVPKAVREVIVSGQPGKPGQLGLRAGAASALKCASDSVLEQVARCWHFTGYPPTEPASQV